MPSPRQLHNPTPRANWKEDEVLSCQPETPREEVRELCTCPEWRGTLRCGELEAAWPGTGRHSSAKWETTQAPRLPACESAALATACYSPRNCTCFEIW